MHNSLATWHWHIEISSKCPLRCPRCARQEVPGTLVNKELALEFFTRNFTPDFIKGNVDRVTFCGDDGDPIYAHDLIPVISYFKSVKPVEIVIVTNGSYRKESWWEELGRVLGENDSIHFSVDGFDDESNNIYRVNSNYDSIITGIRAVRSTSQCRIVWAAIAFSFNQHRISDMKEFAKSLGVDTFQLTKSTKFGYKYPSYGVQDSLEPDPEFVSQSDRFERIHYQLTERVPPVSEKPITLFKQIKDQYPITPLCFIGTKGTYINSSGLLYPCCWVANRYNHNNEWAEISKDFNLHERSLTDVLADTFWGDEFQSFRWYECNTKCSKKAVDEKYASEW